MMTTYSVQALACESCGLTLTSRILADLNEKFLPVKHQVTFVDMMKSNASNIATPTVNLTTWH